MAQHDAESVCRVVTKQPAMSHVLATCQGLNEVSVKVLPEMERLCKLSKNNIDFENICENEESLAQFFLDPTSLNLSQRLQDPLLNNFFKLSRSYCHMMDKTRIELLKQLEA